MKWRFVEKTRRYYYWVNEESFYNCTKTMHPPCTNGGYGTLGSLKRLKGDLFLRYGDIATLFREG